MNTLLQEIEARLAKPTFTHEDTAWTQAALKTLEARKAMGPTDGSRGDDPHAHATDAFFRGFRNIESPVITRGRAGQRSGACTQLQTFSAKEQRTYAGLDSSAPLIPAGFYADCLFALKAYDGIFDAARWITTSSAGPLHVPSGDDTGVIAEKITESQPVNQANPTALSELLFPEAPLWSTKQIVVSFQLFRDAGIDLGAWFAKIFAHRWARGIGASLITTLLAGVATGITSNQLNTVYADELLSLMGSIDSEYATAPTAGWLMNFGTLLSILKLKGEGNLYVFPLELDGQGRPLLLTKPVFISPSMPSIATGHQSIVFGDLSRFVVRNVQQHIVRFDELFAAHHQVAYQGFWQVDGQLAVAGGASDTPMVCLKQPNS